jgi:hypothetical protein
MQRIVTLDPEIKLVPNPPFLCVGSCWLLVNSSHEA